MGLNEAQSKFVDRLGVLCGDPTLGPAEISTLVAGYAASLCVVHAKHSYNNAVKRLEFIEAVVECFLTTIAELAEKHGITGIEVGEIKVSDETPFPRKDDVIN
jgi:hypothetical protein